MKLLELPKPLLIILIVTIGSSLVAAIDGVYELSVVFCFWASLALGIYGFIK